MKTVDTGAYISVLRELADAGETVQVPIRGGSMAPFLKDGRDIIFFRKPERPLRRGDMVFYQRRNGAYVMHRVHRVRPEGLYLVGDGQAEIEGPIQPEQVFARVFAVQRKGKQIGPGDPCWWFFERVWIRIVPLRPMIARVNRWIKRIGNR